MAEPAGDSYLTLASESRYELKIKGSAFIGLAYPAASEDQALESLKQIKKKEHAATHHCFAYIIGYEKPTFKYSDDGEPSGTAGRPIYQAIVGRDLTDVLVIVVRYFGGVKLGTGGLTRAYAEAANEALDRAPTVEKLICDRLRFTVPFAVYDQVRRIIERGRYTVVAQDFSDRVALEIDIRKSHTRQFISQLTELTGGHLDLTRSG